jgi:hypothetical protein
MLLDGATLDEVDAVGLPLRDDTFLVWFHGRGGQVVMPPAPDGIGWRLVIDTDAGIVADGGTGAVVAAGVRQRLVPGSLSVWVAVEAEAAGIS